MGTSLFAVPTLKSLFDAGYHIPLVYTQPQSKSDRGYKLKKSAVNYTCDELSLRVRTPINFKANKEEEKILKGIKPDLVIVVSYGQILPKEILGLSVNGFINIHASLLPKWRGAAPIQRSIMNLDAVTGISIMKIDEKLDHGDVCSRYNLKIKHNENAEELSLRLSKLAAEKILLDVKDIFEGNKMFIPQKHSNATYAKKIDKNEGKIDWTQSADQIIAKINGLYPVPGAWFYFKNIRYKILEAEVSDKNIKPGLIVNDRLEICCGSKSIKVKKIQKEGKKIQEIDEFILGNKIKKGVNLQDE